MLRASRYSFLVSAVLSVSSIASAAPEMFSASFIMHAFGNDVTSGSVYPYTTSFFNAWPLGYDCRDLERYTTNGAPSTRYCSPTRWQRGHPVVGSGTLSIGAGSPPASDTSPRRR